MRFLTIPRIGALAAIALVVGTGTLANAFEVGDLKIGGTIRANYVNGDYTPSGTDAAQRGDNGGNFELDVFRINLDYERDGILGKAEYRWYNGYNFLHTGWIGYRAECGSEIQVGLNRVPFGIGAYGPANSWFFDQHYYVGLSDDMDYGVKYSTAMGDLSLDLAYYAMAENSFVGGSEESARYSYDLVDNDTMYGAYEEEHQFNVRAIYAIPMGEGAKSELGASLQYGLMAADEARAEDADAYAASLHNKTTVGPWALMLQMTSYMFDADYKATMADDGTMVTPNNDLIAMGAYDFAWPVASEGMIPAVALSYTMKPGVEWIDSMTFYNDYSVILKDGQTEDGTDFNDSAMNVTGVAIASGGWYIYVDYAYANGNYFVGNEGDDYAANSVGDFGVNGNDDWNGRFNINFGYYF